MHACPCGYYTDPERECTCTAYQIQRYTSKISGPLLDRIDIQVNVPRVNYEEISSNQTAESSAAVRARVEEAREIQRQRFAGAGIHCNAEMNGRLLRRYARLEDAGQRLLKQAFRQLHLSARAYDRILKVARTIADLDKSSNVTARHVAEAIQYRSLDVKW